MIEENQLQLHLKSILHVPLNIYDKNFTFIVNGEEYQTARIISDLLSPKISQMHITDPTIDSFVIHTKSKGDFSHILELINFQSNSFNESEVLFISEILDILGNDMIEMRHISPPIEITTDNVIKLLKKHEEYKRLYSSEINDEINFISQNFDQLFEAQEKDLCELSKDTIERIISNDNLRIKNEDELLSFINLLYREDNSFRNMYNYVYFVNVTVEGIENFLETFDIGDIDNDIWKSVSNRLRQEVAQKEEHKSRYTSEKATSRRKQSTEFKYEGNDSQFNGIIRYLMSKSNGNISNEMSITTNHFRGEQYKPDFSVSFDDPDRFFLSKCEEGSWICFDFKEHRVIPKHYTIRTHDNDYSKSWVIEGSENESEWVTLDSETNCNHLNGSMKVHTFGISDPNSREFKFIRMRQTGKNWVNCNCLRINSFEIYGTLI